MKGLDNYIPKIYYTKTNYPTQKIYKIKVKKLKPKTNAKTENMC